MQLIVEWILRVWHIDMEQIFQSPLMSIRQWSGLANEVKANIALKAKVA